MFPRIFNSLNCLFILAFSSFAIQLEYGVTSNTSSTTLMIIANHNPSFEPLAHTTLNFKLKSPYTFSSISVGSPEKGFWSVIEPKFTCGKNVISLEFSSTGEKAIYSDERIPIAYMKIEMTPAVSSTFWSDMIDSAYVTQSSDFSGNDLLVPLSKTQISVMSAQNKTKSLISAVFIPLKKSERLEFMLKTPQKLAASFIDCSGATSLYLAEKQFSTGKNDISWNLSVERDKSMGIILENDKNVYFQKLP